MNLICEFCGHVVDARVCDAVADEEAQATCLGGGYR